MNLEKVAAIICDKLLQNGFIIHRYYAFSTNSIYLKLDYGASNSIRISDHEGYQHLRYKYVVLTECKESGWGKSRDGDWQYYCSTSKRDVNKLIEIILADKLYKKTMYNYEKLVEDYKSKINYNISFWRECEELKL